MVTQLEEAQWVVLPGLVLLQHRITRPQTSSPASCSSSHTDPRVVAQFKEAQWEVLPDLVYDGTGLNDEVGRAKKRR